MKKNLFITLAIVSMFLVSCSGSIEPANPAIEFKTHIESEWSQDITEDVPLNEYCEVQSVSAVVVPGKEFPSIHSQINVTINIKFTKDLPDIDNYTHRFSLLNSDGAELEARFLSGDIIGKHAGDVMSLSGHTKEDSNDQVNEMFKQIKYIRLVDFSAWKKVGKKKNDSSVKELNSAKEDWDALLNSYDEYVEKYNSYIKKAVEGDISALSEYPALLEKAQELSSKLEKSKNDISATQWARYMEITNKITQIALDMQ